MQAVMAISSGLSALSPQRGELHCFFQPGRGLSRFARARRRRHAALLRLQALFAMLLRLQNPVPVKKMHARKFLCSLNIAVILSIAFLLPACGQKGDLYVPQKSKLASPDVSQSR